MGIPDDSRDAHNDDYVITVGGYGRPSPKNQLNGLCDD